MKLLLHRGRDGQGLIEAALVLPFLLFITLNAINLGYFFFVYLNLATAPRQGAQYSILGSVTTVNQLPGSDAVHQLVNSDISGAISAAASSPTRVCTLALGTSSPHDMIGGVVLARAVQDPRLSDEILESVRQKLG